MTGFQGRHGGMEERRQKSGYGNSVIGYGRERGGRRDGRKGA